MCSRSRQEGLGRSIFGRFSFVFKGIMARTDWLGDMGTGFGKAVLGIALNFGVFLPLVRDGKDRLGRMGERNARRGYGKKGEGRRLRKDGQGEE